MSYIITADDQGQPSGHPSLSMRCPACHKQGTLDPIGQGDIRLLPTDVWVGSRRCPAADCHTHIFVVWNPDENSESVLVASYPPELLDFDATNIPAKVTEAMQEAIQCHANQCYTAAAIMVRKTLEELCADRKAKGGNLKERITALGNNVVLPQELLDGLDDLRLLGNDASHIESRE